MHPAEVGGTMYQSFMVRIWREDGQALGKVLISAESIQTGEVHHFNTLKMLFSYLHESAESANDSHNREIGLDKSDLT
jgi:hypothetical protein